MPSRKMGLTVSISPKRGLHVYFTKKPSKYNNCIGEAMRKGGKLGSRSAVKQAFTQAVAKCK